MKVSSMRLQVPRISLTVLALVWVLLPAWAFQATTATSTSAAAVTTESIHVSNGDFNRGTAKWKAKSPSPVKFTQHRGRTGPGVRMLNHKWARVVRMTQTEPTVSESSSGDSFKVSAWVRTSRPIRVKLRTVERDDGKTKRQQQGVHVPRGAWTRLSMTVTPAFVGSNLTVAVLGRKVNRGTSLRVDDVRVKRTRKEVRSAPCRTATRGLPKCGAYVGAAYGGNTDVEPLEAQIGGRLAVRRTYFGPQHANYAMRVVQEDLDAGRLPWISFKLPHSWSHMAAGRGDAWAENIAERLAKVDGPVWIAFHHEPEGDGNIRHWTRTQERLAPIIRSVAPNVGYSIILMGWHQIESAGNTDKYGLDTLWPDTKIDLLGIDPYNFYGGPGRTVPAPTDLVSRYFEPISEWAAQNDVAWGVAEMGFTNKTLNEDPLWLQRTYQGLVDNEGVALSYFNSNLNSTADWRLDTPADFQAFSEILAESPRPVTD